MSVHIQYRFLKEKGDYLEDPKNTRGYTVVEANFEYPFQKAYGPTTFTHSAGAERCSECTPVHAQTV